MDTDALLTIGAMMAYQYDVEEQADCFGAPFPEDAEWRRFFSPIAPIQLALQWSPIPQAIEVLGEPCCEASESGESDPALVVMLWNPSQVSEARIPATAATTADAKRFLGLLGVASARGQSKRCGILLAVHPGWSYDTVHPISNETATLMEQHGFVVTDRRSR